MKEPTEPFYNDLWACIGAPPDDAIVAMMIPGQPPYPMVTVKESLTPQFIDAARQVANLTGRSIQVVRFHAVKVERSFP